MLKHVHKGAIKMFRQPIGLGMVDRSMKMFNPEHLIHPFNDMGHKVRSLVHHCLLGNSDPENTLYQFLSHSRTCDGL